MAPITKPTLCACGNVALITRCKDGVTKHECYWCMIKPPSQKEQDTRLLIRLGLIA